MHTQLRRCSSQHTLPSRLMVQHPTRPGPQQGMTSAWVSVVSGALPGSDPRPSLPDAKKRHFGHSTLLWAQQPPPATPVSHISPGLSSSDVLFLIQLPGNVCGWEASDGLRACVSASTWETWVEEYLAGNCRRLGAQVGHEGNGRHLGEEGESWAQGMGVGGEKRVACPWRRRSRLCGFQVLP